MEGLDSGVVLSGVNGVHRVRYGKGKRCPARVELMDIQDGDRVVEKYCLVITVDHATSNVIPIDKLSDFHRNVYGDVIEAFNAGGVDAVVGTPLHLLPFLTKQRIVEYKSRGIRSAEDLIGLSEPQMQELGMGTREEMQKTIAYMKTASDASIVAKQDEQMREMQEKIDRLEMELQSVSVEAPEARRGPGRPRKIENNEVN